MLNPYGGARGSRYLFFVLASIAFPLLALNKNTELNRYGRQTWQIESGLPQNTVHAILQTHDGYLWLATEGGVARFNGLNFFVYDTRNTPQLRSNNVRSLLEDRERNLWIGTADGLTRFNGSAFETFTTEQGLPSNNVWSIFQDHSGGLWVVTADGLAKYEAHRFRSYITGQTSSIHIGGITESGNGALWIATQDGLQLFRDGRLSIPAGAEALTRDNIEALLADTSGRIWVGTSSGLAVYQNGKVATYSLRSGLPSNRISALYQDREGSIWVGTEAGLARISDNKIERVPAYDSSLAGIILCMFEDREGSLWLGTDSGGLTVLRDEEFTTYTSRDGLSDDLVRCTLQDRNGAVWIGTNNGLNRFYNHGFSTLTTKDGLSSNVILSLAEDGNGNLLVGTPDGLDLLRNGRISVITSADGLADDFIRSIYKDSDNSLWIGTRRGLSHSTAGGFKTYTQADGLGSDLIGVVLRDRRGNLWIGTLHGLTRFADRKFTNYTTKNGLSNDVITTLYEDGRGVLWIGTQDGGLNRFEGEKIFRYSYASGLPNSMYSITADTNRNLWMASKAGIFRASEKDLDGFAEGHVSSFPVAMYGTADGLKVSECTAGGHPAGWVGEDGALWFATLKGIATINPKDAERDRQPPPVALESVSIDDQTFNPAQATDVSPGHVRFAFEYAALSFLAPRTLRFKYKLEGFDRDWIDAGTRRIAYYTNIPPGSYRFKVTARGNDGIWNEAAASFAFRLRPHFYQTYWFDFLVILSFILAGWEIYRWRVRQVAARFNAVLAERNRIAREIHDTLAQGFVAVSVQLELLARILGVSNEAAQSLLKKIRVSVQESLAEARRSIWELRSHGTNNDDLPGRFSQLATQIRSTTPLKVRFQVVGTYRPLPPNVESELLKIGQEAVSNVVRHADAKHVDIDLNFEAKKLRLTIVDDGRGFMHVVDSSGPDGHFGLKGMRERAEQIEAELLVKSAPGEGTRVLIEKVIG